jgi:hypothetical protein
VTVCHNREKVGIIDPQGFSLFLYFIGKNIEAKMLKFFFCVNQKLLISLATALEQGCSFENYIF